MTQSAFCSKCGAALAPAAAFCSKCGAPVSGPPSPAVTPPASPGWSAAPPAVKPAKKNRNTAVGCVVVIIVLVAIGAAVGSNKSGSSGSGSSGSGSGGAHLSGTFIQWVPVDEGHGYAYFSVTNSGTASATAKCTISVKDDFGDFGFDMLVGETVGPGQTITGKMAIGVGKGSLLINSGDVKDC